jgi:CelD/BcsL family acetyltransferase involved in cellulose biosynthesis
MNIAQMKSMDVEAEISVTMYDELGQIHALRSAWEALAEHDQDSGVYLSWGWMQAMFAERPGEWRVLALADPTDATALCAVLPLRVKHRWSKSNAAFQTELSAAGRLGFSEYTGILCDPARERWAIAALALALQEMPWSRLSLRYEPTGRRLRQLAAALDPGRVEVSWPEHRINDGAVNQLVSPKINLPDRPEAFGAMLSRSRRQKLARNRRAVAADDSLTIGCATAQSFGADRDGLLQLWRSRWGGEMSARRLDRGSRSYGRLIDRAQALGILYSIALRRDGELVGAQAHILDRKTRQMIFVVGGRDPNETELDVGLLLHGAAIEQAIADGFDKYDFGHGDESYKFGYAATAKPSYYLEARRRSQGGSGFDLSGLPEALRLTRGMVRDGKHDEAIAALREIETLLTGE